MTRKEEIKEVAQKEMSKYPNFCITAPAFRMGAEWADAHPVVKVGGALKNYERGYEEAIDKACEWLEEHHVPSAFGDMSKVKDFVEQFCKAMKGEEDEDHIIDANKKVDRVIGTADHIKTALDVLNKEGGEK